jgi:uncharacterized damage-inducible protein DinB
VQDERSSLVTVETFLDYLRDTVVMKLEGLSEEEARRRLVPSETTLLGIVKHLAFVERFWFQSVFAGKDAATPWSEEDPDADWRVEEWETIDGIVAFYRNEVTKSRKITAKPALNWKARRPDRAGRKVIRLRWIMAHMVEETARHAGHADILRELTDGATGV